MNKTVKIVLIAGAVALGATTAYAAAPPQPQQQTPKGWSWTPGKGGKRTERPSEVTTNADGSTREVIKNGKCVTIKERSASGEYRESRQCNPS
jgi:hypothetical protein